MAKHYKGRSIAEQNSVDLAWNLLISDKYKALRNTIYTTERGKKRFRQLVVNSGRFATGSCRYHSQI